MNIVSVVIVEYRFKGETQLQDTQFANEQQAQSFIWPHRDEIIYGPAVEHTSEGPVMKAVEVDRRRGDWDWFCQRIVRLEKVPFARSYR